MKKRRYYWILSLLLAAPLVLGLAAGWLLNSESGARWLFGRLGGLLPGELEAATLNGSLASGLELERLQYGDEGLRVNAEVLTLAVDVDLLPPSIRIHQLDAGNVDAQTFGDGSAKTDWKAMLPRLALPLPVSVEEARTKAIAVRGSNGEMLVLLDALQLSGSLHRDLELQQLRITKGTRQLYLEGRLGLAAPHRLELALDITGEPSIEFEAEGDLSSARVALRSERPGTVIHGRLQDLLSDPKWALELSAPMLEWPTSGENRLITVRSLTGASEGSLDDYRLELKGLTEVEELQPAHFALNGKGDEKSFVIEHFDWNGPELEFSARGRGAWENEPELRVEAALKRLDPASWVPQWPGNQPVNGRLELSWGQQGLQLPTFELGIKGESARISGKADIDLDSGTVDARLGWSALNWPPGPESPQVISESGVLSASGRLEDWQIEGRLSLATRDLSASELLISGRGNTESMEATLHEGFFLGGRLAGQVDWNWTEAMPFSVKLVASEVDIEPLAPDFPGILTARVDMVGALQPLELSLTVHELAGTVREIPLTARGGLHFSHGQLSARALTVHSGASFLVVNGGLFENAGLTFEFDIDSLSRFAGGLGGDLKGRGMLSLGGDYPRIRTQMTGSELVIGEYAIAALEIRELGATGGSEMILKGLTLGERKVDVLSVVMDGPEPLASVQLMAQADDNSLGVALNGGILDWSRPLETGWDGSLSRLRVDVENRFFLELNEATALRLGPNQMRLDQACFQGSREASLCIDTAWARQDRLRLDVELVSVPLILLELFDENDFEFSQILSGRLEFSRLPGGRANGFANLEISPGAVREAGETEPILETGAGRFGYQITEGQLRSGNLDITFPGAGLVDIDFNIPDVGNGAASELRGKVTIDIPDISVFSQSIPLFDTMGGALDVDLVLSGTVTEPVYDGNIAFRSGHLSNRATGLAFSDIMLDGSVNQKGRSELSGSFRSGDGQGQIELGLELEDLLSPQMDLSLVGESLTVIDSPDLRVIAHPDISLQWANDTLLIGGKLKIPAARLSPSYLPASSIQESEDVVIVAGELPEPEPSALRERPFRLLGALELELGDEVRVDLDLAEARVSGRSRFDWQGNLVPMASGNFDVTGEIQAYGQLLRVTQGRISFPDIPADNPHLNIRAEREIFGNSQITRAGLMVVGTLRRPVIEAYTVPMTNKHRAQTLLVTGSDFNFEQGVGAVDVGTYVLPRLYISYGIGIFEDDNVISVRYDLGHGFGVKASSGARESGLDLNYRIER